MPCAGWRAFQRLPHDPRAGDPDEPARRNGIGDGDWIRVESQWGKVRCMARHSEAVEPGTVWTWNAIGKAAGAWNLTPDANESQQGFLLNHLITEELPSPSGLAYAHIFWHDICS